MSYGENVDSTGFSNLGSFASISSNEVFALNAVRIPWCFYALYTLLKKKPPYLGYPVEDQSKLIGVDLEVLDQVLW